ncbi:MAG: hypothetical protein HFH36_10210 [Lachnospiraceae bacterium]|nr:hypothetical protein [Lachnospiraceae bacterium]
MARRGKEIRIVVHTPSNLPMAFQAENVEDFWIEKMSAKIKENSPTKQELQCLLENADTENKIKG